MPLMHRLLLLVLIAISADVFAARTWIDGWSVDLPTGCTATAARNPAQPLYSAEERATLAQDPTATLKPDYYNLPQHLYIDLAPCFAQSGMFDASLRIVPIASCRGIYDPDQGARAYLLSQLNDLREWLDQGPVARHIWPMVPFLDMSPMYTTGQRALRFGGGHGVRVLTQFVPDVGFAQAGLLSYVFQGLTADGQQFVLLTVPLQAKGLASRDDATHWGHTLDQLDADKAAHQRYEVQVQTWLQSTDADIQPALQSLDRIVRSLRQRPHTTP